MRTQGGWGTGNVSLSCEANGGGTQWDVSVHSGTPLFRSVRGVPLSTGPPHHDKVTGPRVREGVEGGELLAVVGREATVSPHCLAISRHDTNFIPWGMACT